MSELLQEPINLSEKIQHLGIDPAEMSLADAHRLLLHCVAPRPIAFTSTLSAEGTPNLAPFSYFMAGGANPPSVVISPLTDRTGQTDQLRAWRVCGSDRAKPIGAIQDDIGQVGQRFDVVDHRRTRLQTRNCRKWRPRERLGTLSMYRIDQRRLFAKDVATAAEPHLDGQVDDAQLAGAFQSSQQTLL